jgi:hypothetical protein
VVIVLLLYLLCCVFTDQAGEVNQKEHRGGGSDVSEQGRFLCCDVLWRAVSMWTGGGYRRALAARM